MSFHPAIAPDRAAAIQRQMENGPALVNGVPVAEPPVTDEPVDCPLCGRTVAWQATRPYRILCRHCHEDVERL